MIPTGHVIGLELRSAAGTLISIEFVADQHDGHLSRGPRFVNDEKLLSTTPVWCNCYPQMLSRIACKDILQESRN